MNQFGKTHAKETVQKLIQLFERVLKTLFLMALLPKTLPNVWN